MPVMPLPHNITAYTTHITVELDFHILHSAGNMYMTVQCSVKLHDFDNHKQAQHHFQMVLGYSLFVKILLVLLVA